MVNKNLRFKDDEPGSHIVSHNRWLGSSHSSPACWADRTLVCEKAELCRAITETWKGGRLHFVPTQITQDNLQILITSAKSLLPYKVTVTSCLWDVSGMSLGESLFSPPPIPLAKQKFQILILSLTLLVHSFVVSIGHQSSWQSCISNLETQEILSLWGSLSTKEGWS